MLLRDVLKMKGREICTIASHATVGDVVVELTRFNIGSLLVRDAPGGPILGIITERDILRALAAHQAPLEQLRVAACMSSELITARPDDEIEVAMRLMTTHRVRHLPVVQDDELCGILSIGDIVKAHPGELEMHNFQMRSYILGGASSVAAPLA